MFKTHVIVEVQSKGLHPQPLLGNHFFHNITETNRGYFNVLTSIISLILV